MDISAVVKVLIVINIMLVVMMLIHKVRINYLIKETADMGGALEMLIKERNSNMVNKMEEMFDQVVKHNPEAADHSAVISMNDKARILTALKAHCDVLASELGHAEREDEPEEALEDLIGELGACTRLLIKLEGQ